MDAPVKTPAAPELPKAVQLNEDAQLRVLAGTTTYKSEAAKLTPVSEVFDKDAEPGDTKKTSKGVATKTKTGLVHKSTKDYGGAEDADDEKDSKKKDESIDPTEFKSKFDKMVEAKKGSKPDFADLDKDGNKKEPMKKAAKDAKGKKVNEAAKPDYIDLDKDGNKKEPMKKAAADKKAGPKKGENPFAKKTESKMMPKGKKRPVKESVEQKLTFKQMVQLVQESGGQQQIDPIDKELFNWATRVAANKLGEGMKADLYAGLIYERNGGVFEMYDVLSEAQK